MSSSSVVLPLLWRWACNDIQLGLMFLAFYVQQVAVRVQYMGHGPGGHHQAGQHRGLLVAAVAAFHYLPSLAH